MIHSKHHAVRLQARKIDRRVEDRVPIRIISADYMISRYQGVSLSGSDSMRSAWLRYRGLFDAAILLRCWADTWWQPNIVKQTNVGQVPFLKLKSASWKNQHKKRRILWFRTYTDYPRDLILSPLGVWVLLAPTAPNSLIIPKNSLKKTEKQKKNSKVHFTRTCQA